MLHRCMDPLGIDFFTVFLTFCRSGPSLRLILDARLHGHPFSPRLAEHLNPSRNLNPQEGHELAIALGPSALNFDWPQDSNPNGPHQALNPKP